MSDLQDYQSAYVTVDPLTFKPIINVNCIDPVAVFKAIRAVGYRRSFTVEHPIYNDDYHGRWSLWNITIYIDDQ